MRRVSMPDRAGYDVLVVGAGLVGAATALGLRGMGLRVLLVDAVEIKDVDAPNTPSFDTRSTALSYGSSHLLDALGIWRHLKSSVSPITEIHVSEKGKMGQTRLSSQDYGLEALGYVAPNQAIGYALYSCSGAQALELLCPASVEQIQSVECGQKVTLNAGGETRHELRVSLVVVCDGAESQTAKSVGIHYRTEPYGQAAIVSNVKPYDPHNGCAYERFTASGPLALLPLGEHMMSLVWTMPEAESAHTLALSDSAFLKALDDAMGGRMGGFESCARRAAYPLKLTQAEECARQGMILLGNAAHSLHPVAGQGFNLALRGLGAFLEQVGFALQADKPVGSLEVLSKAVQSHALDQWKTVTFSDQLVRNFSNDANTLGLVRELGLIGLNNLPFAKQQFVEQAMGLGGKAYRLEEFLHAE